MNPTRTSRTQAILAFTSSLAAFILECLIVPTAHLLPESSGFYAFSWAIALTLILASVGIILGDISYRQSKNTYSLLGIFGGMFVLILFLIGTFALMRPQ